MGFQKKKKKLTQENISSTEKEGKKYAFSNWILQTKLTSGICTKQNKLSTRRFTVVLEKTSSLCPGFFSPKF